MTLPPGRKTKKGSKLLRHSAVYDFRQAIYVKETDRGTMHRDAQRIATDETARKFRISHRGVQRYVAAWPKREAKLRTLKDARWEKHRNDAALFQAVTRWLSRDELEEFAARPIGDLSQLAIRRATAEVDRLLSERRVLTANVLHLAKRIDALEAALSKCRTDATVRSADLTAYNRAKNR